MKIALINGSPKISGSASGSILQDLRSFLEDTADTIYDYHFKKPIVSAEEVAALSECDILIFAFPLYVDGIPSHLLRCLVQLEQSLAKANKEITVYVVANCGFYEGHQNRLAISMMENWCTKAGLKWGQGIGIGAGGMLSGNRSIPLGYGPKKNLGKALTRLAENVCQCASDENVFITANFPKIAYKLGAEINWWLTAKANGLKRRDLSLRK
jgi:multimeric flavodoxin WrbA